MADFINKFTEEIERATEELYELFTGGNTASSESGSNNNGNGNNGNFRASGVGGGGDAGSYAHEFDLSDMDFDGDDLSEEAIQEMLAEELMKTNPLQGIADGVTADIMAGQAGPQTVTEHFQAFRSAINWSEGFIVGLIVFQIIMFVLCFLVSRRDGGLAPRLALMVFVFAVVRSAEWLNAMGEEHWESFATQDYFDKRGIFVAIMLSGPLLLDVLMMLLFFIREASVLLVEVKRTEIRRKKAAQQSNNNNNAATGTRGKKTKAKKQE